MTSLQESDSFDANKSDEEITELLDESNVKEIELSSKVTQVLIQEKKANIETVKSKGKSEVWKNFGKVLVFGLTEKDIKTLKLNTKPKSSFYVKNVVACKQCYACYTHISHKSGTSSLRKHNCIKKAESQSLENTQIITKWCTKIPKSVTIPENIKYEIQVQSLKFILNQLLAFKTIDETPFRELLQKCIEIGANYGNIDINDILCGRKKLTDVIMKKKYDECMSSIIKSLDKVYGMGFTLDFWQEDFRKITYVSLTLHFVDENYILKSRIINSNKFGFDKKTADNINILFSAKLNELKIDQKNIW